MATEKATPRKVAPTGFVINVGLFAEQANADRVQQRLKALEQPLMVDRLQTRRGPRTRVRVGPFESEKQAEREAEKIRAQALDAIVAPL